MIRSEVPRLSLRGSDGGASLLAKGRADVGLAPMRSPPLPLSSRSTGQAQHRARVP
jgi:hypothetical protein